MEAIMYVTDDKLPDDVLRKAYDETRRALCCSECNFQSSFDPRTLKRSENR